MSLGHLACSVTCALLSWSALDVVMHEVDWVGTGAERASDGIVAMCDAICSLEDSVVEWSSNVGVLAHVGKSEATVSNCTLRNNFIGSGNII
jgi:hypothetical protein